MIQDRDREAVGKFWSVPAVRFGALFFLLMLVHLIWAGCNDAPPVWDMAHHQLRGWDYLGAWNAGTLTRDFPRLSSYYPPLYYLQEACVLHFFASGTWLAFLSNLPGLFLLGWSSFRIASLIGVRCPHWAGCLPLLFPLVAWTSRESLLDPSLCGWVAFAVYLILRSQLLCAAGGKLALAAVVSAGMLTKWTFAIFLFFPLLYTVLYSSNRKKTFLGLLDVLILSLPAIFWWYLPNLTSVAERFDLTTQAAAVESDPGFTTLLGWLYYPRSLSSYYLHLPLTATWIVGLWRSGGRTAGAGSHRALLWWWLGGGLFLLTIIDAKDPRYVMPLAAPVAILLVDFWQDRPPWLAAVLGVAWGQYLLISFSLLGPVRLVWFDLPSGTDYRTLRQEWVLFQNHYFDVAGPPRQEDWRYQGILAVLPDRSRVGFAPEMPRFHPGGLTLYARRSGGSVQALRVGHTKESLKELETLEWLVTKGGKQGLPHLTGWNEAILPSLQKRGWVRKGRWRLPDGSFAELWQNPRAGEPGSDG